MAFFQGVGESVVGGGLGSVAEMWGDGVVSVVATTSWADYYTRSFQKQARNFGNQ